LCLGRVTKWKVILGIVLWAMFAGRNSQPKPTFRSNAEASGEAFTWIVMFVAGVVFIVSGVRDEYRTKSG
jgi:hypothetical protein